MPGEPAGVAVGRNRLGIVEEIGQHDDVGLERHADLAEQAELLQCVVVADAEVEAVDLAAGLDQSLDDLVREGLLLGDAPAHGDRIADEGDAGDAVGRLVGDLGSAQALLVGPDMDAHQLGLGVRAVAMAEVGPHVAFLHPARVLPHFELVQHAVVENEAGEAFHSEQTKKRSNQDQQKI